MTMQGAASGVALWRQGAGGPVRRALAALAERGLVRAERGSGTYVETQRLAYPLRSRTRFSEIVGAGGREPRGELIDASEEVATRELARELGLKTGAPLIRIESVRLGARPHFS